MNTVSNILNDNDTLITQQKIENYFHFKYSNEFATSKQ
jgi:hypothetical protein